MARSVATTPIRTARSRKVLTRSGALLFSEGLSILKYRARRRCGVGRNARAGAPSSESGQHDQVGRLQPFPVLERQHGAVLGMGRDVDREELVDGVEDADRA